MTNLPSVVKTDKVYLRGGIFLGDDVIRFADLTKSQSLLSVDMPRNDVGFRVVIEAKGKALRLEERGGLQRNRLAAGPRIGIRLRAVFLSP